MESKDLWVELRPGSPSYMVLKGTYGEEIHKTFRMTRQGVRWRFQRLFSHVYVEAFETILMIEKTFGTQLREHAIQISRERSEARREAVEEGLSVSASVSREHGSDTCRRGSSTRSQAEKPGEGY
jgi:hypothetical protein